MANGTGWIAKTLLGGSMGVALTAMGFMGNGIVENDRRNTDQHTEIRKELHASVIDIKDDIADMKSEQQVLFERIEKKL